MKKILLAFGLGLVVIVVGFLVVEVTKSFAATLGTMAALYLGGGWLVSRRVRKALWRGWPSMVSLNVPLWLLVATAFAPGGETGEGRLAFLAVGAAGWLATCAGVYLTSKSVIPRAGAKPTLAVLGIPVLAFAALALFTYTTGRLTEPTLIDGIPCASGWIVKHPGGRLQRCALSAKTEIAGHELPEGTEVTLDPHGKLVGFKLSRGHTVSGLPLPAGTWVECRPDGTAAWCFLGKDAEIQGHLCRGGKGHGWITSFYPNGTLRGAYLARDEVIQEVPCARATFWREVTGGAFTYFDKSGRLRRCRIARNVTIRGVPFKQGDQIRLDENGNPVRTK